MVYRFIVLNENELKILISFKVSLKLFSTLIFFTYISEKLITELTKKYRYQENDRCVDAIKYDNNNFLVDIL